MLKKHYKEFVDALRQSGAGGNSDNDCLMDFRWFAEIHSIVGTRAVVQPSSLMDTSVADSRSRTSSVTEERPRTPSVAEKQQPRIPVVGAEKQNMTLTVGDGQSTSEQPGPSSEDIPGPSSATSTTSTQPRLPKRRKLPKLDKVHKATLVDTFKEMEKSQ